LFFLLLGSVYICKLPVTANLQGRGVVLSWGSLCLLRYTRVGYARGGGTLWSGSGINPFSSGFLRVVPANAIGLRN